MNPKFRQWLYISDPNLPQYKGGEFTGWLTENEKFKIAYMEVFNKNSRKQGHLETVCVDSKYLSTTTPININFSGKKTHDAT
jgi:hypothetical protein